MLIVMMMLTLSAGEAGAASKGAISGTVRDAKTGDVLSNVSVMISELGRGTITNTEGAFLLRGISPGPYTARAKRVGYTPSQDSLIVAEGAETVLEIRLFRKPIPMEPIEVRAPRTVRGRADDASRAAEDRDPSMRRKATQVLASTRDRRSVEPLVARLYDRSMIVRVEIIRTLGEIGDVRAAEPLLDVLQRNVRSFEPERSKTEERLHKEAAAALEKIIDANPGDVKMLVGALSARDLTIRRKAASRLRRSYRPEVVDALIDALGDEDWYVKREAALTLPRFQDVRAVPSLIGLLKDDKVQVRRAAAWALGELPDETGREALIDALGDEDWGVRKEAVVSLGKSRDPSARESLSRVMDDPRREVREAAQWALSQL